MADFVEIHYLTYRNGKAGADKCRLLDQDWATAQMARRLQRQVQHEIADGMLGVGEIMQCFGDAIENTLGILATSCVLW